MTPQERFATHDLHTPETCRHGKAVVWCPICDGGEVRCFRCRGRGPDLEQQPCAVLLVGSQVLLLDGWRGRAIAALPDGRAVRVEFGSNGRTRNVTLDKIREAHP